MSAAKKATGTRELPIFFSAPMVLALLAGRKTQTRRMLNLASRAGKPVTDAQAATVKPKYGAVGDRLWVRETWYCDHYAAGDHALSCNACIRCSHTDADRIADWRELLSFRADGEPDFEGERVSWCPSIFMPRWASRLTLEITAEERVERLQALTEDDARAEGVVRDTNPCDHARRSCKDIGCLGATHRAAYARLWDDINGAGSWTRNPRVRVVTFRRVDIAASVVSHG